jgi:DNA-binding PadR family transcriptional regulator
MKTEKTTTTECLLGLLSLKPMSGYELRRMMEQSTANFWRESFGQIYPALKKLSAEGLAAMEVSHPEGQRLRKIYRLTEAGRERLRLWLELPAEPQVARNELLLKLFFGAQAVPEAMRRHVQERRGRLEVDLRRYREIERSLQAAHAGRPGLPYFLMVVRFGIAETRALLAWCDESLAELDREVGRQRSAKEA